MHRMRFPSWLPPIHNGFRIVLSIDRVSEGRLSNKIVFNQTMIFFTDCGVPSWIDLMNGMNSSG